MAAMAEQLPDGLSILMPVYNEIERIERALDATLAVNLPCPFELVLVDDGSTDGTVDYLRNRALPDNVRVHYQAKNRGKGAAVRPAPADARLRCSAASGSTRCPSATARARRMRARSSMRPTASAFSGHCCGAASRRNDGPMSRAAAAKLVWIVVSLVSLAAVVWWATRQHAPKMPTSGVGVAWLVASLGAYGAAIVLRGWRWHRILNLSRVPHERADAFWLIPVAYMGNTVLPLRGGEV